MSTLVKTAGRTREVEAALILRFYIQADAAIWTDGSSAANGWLTQAMNAVDAAADAQTAASGIWFHGAGLGPADPGLTHSSWYGQEIHVHFRAVQASGAWATLAATAQAIVAQAFAAIPIWPMGREITRPNPSMDLANPSRYVEWTLAGAGVE